MVLKSSCDFDGDKELQDPTESSIDCNKLEARSGTGTGSAVICQNWGGIYQASGHWDNTLIISLRQEFNLLFGHLKVLANDISIIYVKDLKMKKINDRNFASLKWLVLFHQLKIHIFLINLPIPINQNHSVFILSGITHLRICFKIWLKIFSQHWKNRCL